MHELYQCNQLGALQFGMSVCSLEIKTGCSGATTARRREVCNEIWLTGLREELFLKTVGAFQAKTQLSQLLIRSSRPWLHDNGNIHVVCHAALA
jgi:hypothetical protein